MSPGEEGWTYRWRLRQQTGVCLLHFPLCSQLPWLCWPEPWRAPPPPQVLLLLPQELVSAQVLHSWKVEVAAGHPLLVLGMGEPGKKRSRRGWFCSMALIHFVLADCGGELGVEVLASQGRSHLGNPTVPGRSWESTSCQAVHTAREHFRGLQGTWQFSPLALTRQPMPGTVVAQCTQV